jgi:hypothetical protein
VAVYFDLYNGGSHNPRTGLLLNGAGTPGDTRSLAGIINLGSGDPIRVHLTYDSGTLSEVLTDTITGAVFSTTYTVNIPTVVGGGGLAYVGFTAATGGESAIQDILDWSGVFAGTAPPPYLTVQGFPSPTAAGAAQTFTVTAYRGSGIVNTTYFGTVHFSSSDLRVMSGVQLPADYTFSAADNGSHTFAADLVTAGTQSITATDTQTGAIVGTETGIVVTPAAASTFVVTAAPASITAGDSTTLTVTAYDAYGNVATGYGGTVHLTSSDGQAVLPADATLTNGTGTFSATLKTAGSQTITATDAVNSSVTGAATVTVTPATASYLVVAGYPSPTNRMEAHTFTVTAYDIYGNVATGYLGTITFSSDESHADLPSDYTFTAADAGVHTFSATFNRFGTFYLRVRDTANPSITGEQDGIVVE